MPVRSIRKIITATTEKVGAGELEMLRLIGPSLAELFDPFLLLYVFDYEHPEQYAKGIPWHAHRGLETITYLFRGDLRHVDSLGNRGRILDGGCQWMTAGSGIMHQEMPRPLGEPEAEKESLPDRVDRISGVQLWLNMPSAHKWAAPGSVDAAAKSIPVVKQGADTIKVLSGQYAGQTGPFTGEYVRLLFLDVTLGPDRRWALETRQNDNVFVAVLRGAGWFDETGSERVESRQGVLFYKGDELIARADREGIHFLVFAAQSLREPIAWHENIVMNSDEELSQAMRELRQGKFIR